jgi:hypothetical protein
MSALKKAKKVPIEIGVLEAAGMKASVMAEVRNGLITEVRPLGCDNCGPARKLGKKGLRKALKRVIALGKPTMTLPIPISSLVHQRRKKTIIVWGPIMMIKGSDFCIVVNHTDGAYCMYCQSSSVPICGVQEDDTDVIHI